LQQLHLTLQHQHLQWWPAAALSHLLQALHLPLPLQQHLLLTPQQQQLQLPQHYPAAALSCHQPRCLHVLQRPPLHLHLPQQHLLEVAWWLWFLQAPVLLCCCRC
jgi:hypothetical protein